MRFLRLAFPSAVVGAGILVSLMPVRATPAYGKKEKKSCTVCHVKVVKHKAEMTKNLTAVGTCYKENAHSLAKCSPAK